MSSTPLWSPGVALNGLHQSAPALLTYGPVFFFRFADIIFRQCKFEGPHLGRYTVFSPDAEAELASLVKKAFNNVASISKGESGFRSTGIFPLNHEVFTEDFLAAEILQSETITMHDCNESLSTTSTTPSASKEVSSPAPSMSKEVQSPAPCTSKEVHLAVPSTLKQMNSPGPSISTQITLANLIKLPEKTHTINTRQGRRKQHATILTSTPVKENLIEKENKKTKKKGGKETQKGNKKWKGKGQGKKTKVQKTGPEKVKRQVLQESNETSVSDVGTNDLCQDDEDDDAEDAGQRCLVCNDLGRNNEMWFRCIACGLWAHSECTGLDSAEVTFSCVCDIC